MAQRGDTLREVWIKLDAKTATCLELQANVKVYKVVRETYKEYGLPLHDARPSYNGEELTPGSIAPYDTSDDNPIVIQSIEVQPTPGDIVDRRINELTEEVKYIKLYQNVTPSHTSLADFYKDRVKTELSIACPINDWENFTRFACFDGKRMSKGGETDTVLQYWQHTLIPELNSYCFREVNFVDTHGRYILKTKKPDICVMRKGMSETPLNIIAVGELKGDPLTNSDRGQLEQYLHCLLEAQKFRHTAYGFLTNNDDFCVVHASKLENNRILCKWCIEAKCGQGQQLGEQALSWLAGLTLKEHGYESPVTVTGLWLEDYLGSGSVSVVYKGSYQGDSVVVKVYNSTDCLHHEKSILEKLCASEVPNVPKIKKAITKALILMPVAEHLEARCVKKGDVHKIVTTLHRAHHSGIVHRDIRIPNLFKLQDSGDVLVNDWGFAVYISDGPQKYYGAISEASDRILDAKIENPKSMICPDPRDDLHALARTFFRLIYCPPPKCLPPQPSCCSDLQKIKHYWSIVNKYWKHIFTLADSSDVKIVGTYNKFADALSDLLPTPE